MQYSAQSYSIFFDWGETESIYQVLTNCKTYNKKLKLHDLHKLVTQQTHLFLNIKDRSSKPSSSSTTVILPTLHQIKPPNFDSKASKHRKPWMPEIIFFPWCKSHISTLLYELPYELVCIAYAREGEETTSLRTEKRMRRIAYYSNAHLKRSFYNS